MRRYLLFSIILVVTLAIGIIYGISIQRYKVFPYKQIKNAYQYLSHGVDKSYGPWSIGIYIHSTPFDLADSEDILNPVLTGKDVDDIDAEHVADPFMIIKDGRYYMFFEVKNRETNQGDIGYAESEDGLKWKYKKIVIDEKYHLSYPCVFEWQGNYYLIPESHENLSVQIYMASSFPEEWKFIGNILNGHHYVDPTIFRYNNKWWLFVSNTFSDVLNLYYSEELLTGWKPHPMNPIIKLDKNISRPGGKVIVYDDHIYRLTQDDDPSYGIQVFAFEITELSGNSYKEKIFSEEPVVKKTGKGWNADGMHHVDLHNFGDGWIAVVDGKNE